MPRPEVSQAAELLYGRLWPYTLEDEANEWHLLLFCEALAGTLFEQVRSYVADGASFVWTPDLKTGVEQVDDYTFEKVSGAEGNGSVTSVDGFTEGCRISFRPQTNNKGFGIGLNSDPESSQDFNSIDYWLNCSSAGNILIRESGAFKLETPYKIGDLLEITYDGTTVRYWKNGVQLREVARPVGAALFLDSWWNHIGGRASNVQFGPFNQPELEDLPGWAIIFNVDICPPAALPYLAQFVGVHLEPSLTVAQQREKIKERPAFKRGTPAAILSAVKKRLTGTKFVFMEERFEGKAYRLFIRTFDSETPDPAATLSDILEQKPAGIVLDYDSTEMKTYAEIKAENPTYQQLKEKGTYAQAVAGP